MQIFHRPQEIADAYVTLRRAETCMSYPKEWYGKDLPHHPSYVYGAGDLALATDGASRVLVWPERKIIGRVYGPTYKALVQELEDEGYAVGSLLGARLLSINFGQSRYLMPYIDEGQMVHRLDVDLEWLIGPSIRYSDYATNTNGYIVAF